MEVCTKLLDVKNLNKVQLKILKTIGINPRLALLIECDSIMEK